MVKMTYGLYQNGLQKLAKYVAMRDLGLNRESMEFLIETLQHDRGEHFKPKVFWDEVTQQRKEIVRLRPELVKKEEEKDV